MGNKIKKENIEELLKSYVEALFPIIYINHFDFKYVDELIEKTKLEKNIVEFVNGIGVVDHYTRVVENETTLIDFLKNIGDYGYESKNIIILKDVHDNLNDVEVISRLKQIIYRNSEIEGYASTIIIVSSKLNVPSELNEYITVLDIPLPKEKEIEEILNKFIEDYDQKIEEKLFYDLITLFKGLNRIQITQILNRAYQKKGTIDIDSIYLILKTKEQLIKKRGLLELIVNDENIENIGGLSNLKNWLKDKEKIFRDLGKAKKFGVDLPRGVLIAGLPGCGKSLSAKATSELFRMPLIRLDVGKLLGKYVGESEQNMREALKLAEAISPCVLWIDEIEKAFSGIGADSSANEVTTRLFGQFLTWMQEKKSSVFIVATANDISKLPPEFLRKGRFDEIFYVDLPSIDERKKILEIHLKKRKKITDKIDLTKIAELTKEYSGADLEAVVKIAIEKCFIDNKIEVETNDLENAVKEIKGIGENFKDIIKTIRDNNKKFGFKDASLGGK
ncbi:AAA family ATPase [Streptobacillus canis]|uniref:AAA family ATPase n=1 Tax=Streptobacillus canis TaxID=2678686 RepID=UPI0018CC2402|nr:AAA family ATPase [Streptobacillus canis]